MIVDKMRHAVDGIMNTIHHHAFNVELSEGILPREKFIFYLIQDALYLADFAKALALTAGRLVNNTHVQQFIQFALDAIKAECELHFGYIDKYRSSTDLAFDLTVEQSPTCFMYTNYLLKMASLASVEEAVSSLLPCFLVYNEVGKRMASHQISNNPYHDWIALYSSDAFELSVSLAIQITNELALTASECIQEKMVAAFVRATQLEWLFWESAYCQESWLVAGRAQCNHAGFSTQPDWGISLTVNKRSWLCEKVLPGLNN